MIQKYPNFNIEFQVDYVDDGEQLMQDKYALDYVEIMRMVYMEWSISINKGKSQIIINTNTPHRIQWLSANFPDYKHNSDGQLIFLGVPHGGKQCNIIYTNILKI